jgi:hypothetical protein
MVTMGLKDFINGVREAYQENKEKGFGFPVELEGSFVKFILDIQDGDHYIALDTDVLCSETVNDFFTTRRFSTAKSMRYVVSQHTINFCKHLIEIDDDLADIAALSLENIHRSLQDGYQISIVPPVTEEEITQLGCEVSYHSAVICSFYKAKREIESIHKDWRRLYIASLPSDRHSASLANHLNLPIYIINE